MHEPKLQHGQHMISGLPETLIDAKRLDLTVAKVEGDAMLFYKEGQVPPRRRSWPRPSTCSPLFTAGQPSFSAPALAAAGLAKLWAGARLKVVAHAGQLGFTTVRQHRKPFGKAVVVHRLLNNNVLSHEYLLLTDDLRGAERSAAPAWAGTQHRRASYAGLGTVGHVHVSLRPPAAEAAPTSAAFSLQGLWGQLVVRLSGHSTLK